MYATKGANTKPVARVYPSEARIRTISITARPIAEGENAAAPLGRQRFRLAHREPCEGDRGDHEEGGEDRAPPREPDDHLSERRRDARDQDEHRKHHRHEAPHAGPLVPVAYERHGHDARCRNPDPLKGPPGDHRVERGREDGHDATGHEQGEAGMDGGLASDAVGEGAEDDLADPDSQEHGGDDELAVVRVRGSEVASDHGERRQHRIGRERDERHQEGDEENELRSSKRGCVPLRPHRQWRSMVTIPPRSTASARNFKPSAQMTLTTVSNAGLRSPESALQRLSRERPRIACNLRHALGAGDVAQRLGNEPSVVIGLLHAGFQVT